MHLLNPLNIAILTFISSVLLPLTTSTPANTNTTTNPTKSLILSISHVDLAADECPTPPTEFLPYSPPPGYVPGPGCPPASSGTQPSENNPPPGFYGGSGSGSGSGGGSSPEYTSQGGGLREKNPFKGIWRFDIRQRKMPEKAWRSMESEESREERRGFWRRKSFCDVLPGVYWPLR